MRHRLSLAAGLLVLAFHASAGVVPKPIAPQLPVELVHAQQEITIDVPTTATGVGMQFGLIGALIGSAVQNAQAKGAEERIVPLRDALVGYDFNAQLEAALRAKLKSDDISPDPQFVVLTPAAVAERTEKRLEMPAQALVLAPRYSMDYEMTTLTVKVVATLELRERKSNGKYKLRPQFKHTYALSFPIAQPNKTAQPWIALGKQSIVAMLEQGVVQVTDMIAYDFSDAGRAEWDRDNRKQYVHLKDRGFPGMGIRQEADYVWARTGKFDQQTVQGWYPVDGPVAAPVAKVEATAAVDATPATAEAQPVAPAAEPVATPAATPDATPAAAGGTQ
jgi:hypothetical protein